MRRFIDNSGLLIAGTFAALVWANISHASYERFADALHFVVNDVAMVFFFALATKEVVEATAPGGALHSPRRALVPMLAAVGGMAGPAGIYVALALAGGVPELLRGWAIPCATDIAFSYLVARFVLGRSHPGIPFLLLLAIADDALGLVILAAFYPAGTIRPLEFMVLLAAAVAIARWLRKGRIRSFWPYVAGAGVVSWIAFYPRRTCIPRLRSSRSFRSCRTPGAIPDCWSRHHMHMIRSTRSSIGGSGPLTSSSFSSDSSTLACRSRRRVRERGSSLPRSCLENRSGSCCQRRCALHADFTSRPGSHGVTSSWSGSSRASALRWPCSLRRPHSRRVSCSTRRRWGLCSASRHRRWRSPAAFLLRVGRFRPRPV